MQIACLGWGSLIWNSGSLKLSSGWNSDGPLLPIEFARESLDGRMTLVLLDEAKQSPSLWAVLTATDIETAKDDLAKREGVPEKSIRYSIGYWDRATGTSHGKCSEEISKWAFEKGLDGVVWTNLKYGFQASRDQLPALAEVIEHLNKLSQEKRNKAKEYVCRTPAQIRTDFRSELEGKLGWLPVNCDT